MKKERLSGRADIKNNYPWLLSTINRLGLTRAFPQWFRAPPGSSRVYIPSDLEIIRAILLLNPRYDLGDLLNWLRARNAVCPRVVGTEIYRLVTQNGLNSMDVLHYSNIMAISLVSDTKQQADSLTEYLANIGLVRIQTITASPRSVTVSAGQNEPETLILLSSLIEDFLGTRMCLLDYLPRYVWYRD
jgi:hypothetical protein